MQKAIEQITGANTMAQTSIGKTNQTISYSDAVLYDEPVVVKTKRKVNALETYGIYERYKDITFANIKAKGLPNQCKEQAILAWRYADNIAENIKHGQGLILKGPVGTMKTTLAVAIMRKAIEDGYTAYFIPMVSLLDTIFTMKDSEEKRRFENKIRNTQLLILDDLGAEYDQQWVLAKVDAIVTERYNRMRSTIVTTNMGIEMMKNRYNARILDRLRSSSEVISFQGKSLR